MTRAATVLAEPASGAARRGAGRRRMRHPHRGDGPPDRSATSSHRRWSSRPPPRRRRPSAGGLDRPAELFLVSSKGDTREARRRSDADIVNVVDLADLPRQVIEQLIAQQPKASSGGSDLTNAIPPTSQVLNATVDGDVLDLDLSDLGQVESSRQRLAVAQIVFTATALAGITRRALLDRRRAGRGPARRPGLRRRPGRSPAATTRAC